MQLFHWTRNPAQAAKIAQRKDEVYESIMNGVQPAEVPGVRSFLDTLRNYNVSAWVWFVPGLISKWVGRLMRVGRITHGMC